MILLVMSSLFTGIESSIRLCSRRDSEKWKGTQSRKITVACENGAG